MMNMSQNAQTIMLPKISKNTHKPLPKKSNILTS